MFVWSRDRLLESAFTNIKVEDQGKSHCQMTSGDIAILTCLSQTEREREIYFIGREIRMD